MVSNSDRVTIAWFPCAKGTHVNGDANNVAKATADFLLIPKIETPINDFESFYKLFIYMKGDKILALNPKLKRIKLN